VGRAPDPTRRRRRLAPVAAAVVALAGLAVLTAGLFSSAAASNRLATMGLGVILLFVGVALSARWFVRPLASAVGWPLERLFSEPGLLARENAMRSPARTATTAAALMVGLGLVVFVAVFADGLKTSITGSVDKLISADVIVRGQSNFVPLPEATSRAVRSARGVGIAADVYVDQVQVNGHPSSANTDVIGGIEPGQFPLVYRARWIAGTPADIFSRLRVGTALIEEQFAKTHHIAVGQRFSILTPSGARANLLAIGEYRDPQVMQGVMISVDQFRAVSSNRDPWVIMARRANGTSADAARDSVTAALAPFPTAKAQSQAQYKDSINAQLNQFVYLLYALLAMSVVISLFGIANSLFLSIHERTREFGLLRAVGATRRQVREIVRLESVITAVIGGLLGTVVGVAFAWLVTQALGDLGLGFWVPVAQLVGFLILAVLVGFAAAAIPARRGARVSVMTALQTE
jgi:putative ABC transport system permease protein